MASDLDDLAARFAARAIPRGEWTHRAHLAVGAWHALVYGLEEALPRLRDGIRRLNDAHGTPNSPTSGYHETVTRAYLQLIAAFLDACPPDATPSERVDRLLHGPLGDRNALLRFYSRERLGSLEARTAWLEPDLAALDLDFLLVAAAIQED